jgi:hypothetical protein
VTADGTVLIADSQNNRIRAVDTDGVITTVAGTGAGGDAGDGGPATAAQLSNPIGVATTPAGAVAIASQLANTIRLIEGASVPGPVEGLTAAVEGTTVTLDWAPPVSDGGAPVTGYVVLRDGVVIGQTDVAVTTFVDPDRTPGSTVVYEVRAVNVAGEGPAVALSVDVAVDPVPPAPPTPPDAGPGGTSTPAVPVTVTPRYTG